MSGFKRCLRILASLAVLLCLCVLPAAAAPASDATLGSTEKMNLAQMMHTGGGVMYVLAFASILTVTFVVYFLVVMRVGYVAPKSLHRDIVDEIKSGANLDELQKMCEDNPCPLSMIVVAALDYLKSGAEGGVKTEALKDIMEGEGARQADEIQGRAQYLLDIAVLSPMLGLLGTVIGMLNAFNAVALENSIAKPLALAGGVSQALVATCFGLIVGIPAMGFYGYFRRKASAVVSSLEVASLQIYTVLSARRGK